MNEPGGPQWWANDPHSQPVAGEDGLPTRDASNGQPDYGLLTRTLVHSPVVKKILSARIRRLDLNDVVFVGETYIQLYTLTAAGKLQTVGCKRDFTADIRDARVFGSPRQSNLSGMFTDVAMGADGEEDLKFRFPPDILVMTMDSGHLAFLYAKDLNEEGEVEFVVSMKRIGPRGPHPDHLGKSIAVDPQSRALAVCAYTNSFRMYSLHPMEELHRQMEAGMPLDPIKEEKTFEVDGAIIVHMEFLHPSPEDKDHVILVLFLVDSEQKSRLQLYEWWTSKELQTASIHGKQDVLFPVHLIPLMVDSAFLIVTETCTHVVKMSDIMSGMNSYHRLPLSQDPPQNLVTAWARPFRHPDFVGHDDIYLAMENGDIVLLQVDAKSRTAFAALDYGLEHDDMFVAGGEMSSGGIYMFCIGPHPVGAKLEGSVANWAPVFDFELVNLAAAGLGNGMAKRDRVYACTGRGDHGAITELRYGIQTLAEEVMDFVSGVRQLFFLPDSFASGRGFFVLCSMADQSFLCYRSLEGGGEWYQCEGIKSLELEEPTLAAGSVEVPGKAVAGNQSSEYTQSALWSVQLQRETSAEASNPRRRIQRRCDYGDVIIAAAIYERFVLLTIRNGMNIKMVLASISIEQDSDEFLIPVASATALEDDPTFVGIIEFQGRPMAIVGTRHATIQIYLCDSVQGLVPLKEENMFDHAGEIQNDLAFCESAVIIYTDTKAKLLCGLRGGTLIIFDVTTNGSSLGLRQSQSMRFGPIAVQLYQDVHRKNAAFVLAGPEAYRFEMPKDHLRASQLIFDLQESSVDPDVLAIVQIPDSEESENTLICVANDQIFCAEFGKEAKMCSRRLRLYETPRRVLLYAPENVLIVACSKTDKVGQNKDTFCSLKLLDPKTGNSRVPPGELMDRKKEEAIFNKPDEQIHCLTEWQMEVSGQMYTYIALGTGATQPFPYGRVIVLSLSCNAEGNLDVRRRFQIHCDNPVYSLAPYGPSSLVYCAGKTVFLKTLNPETRKLDLTSSAQLRSPAIKLTVKEPFIYASTTADSLLVLTVNSGTLTNFLADSVARNGLTHFHVADLVLASDKMYTLAGLWQPAIPRALASLECLNTVFEAEVSSSVSKICSGAGLRPPWKSPTDIPGVVDGGNLLASGIDGSFFQLFVVDGKARRLLEMVEGLMGGGEVGGAVNGDRVWGVVARGSEWLRAAVEKAGLGRFEGVGWEEAVRDVLGDDGREGDSCERVVEWVRMLCDDAVL